MSNQALKFTASCLGWILLLQGIGFSQEVTFEKVVLDPEIGKVCYAVTAADIDGDSRLDPVAISEREAFWFRNPDWKKHTMISDAVPTDHVCIVPADIDRDGKVDFALGAGWPRNGGTLHWIRRGKSLEDPWQVHSIAAEAWTHRMRVADVLGQGEPQLVVTPLNATTGAGIRLLAFPIPDNPASASWNPIVIDGSLNRAHNHWHLPGKNNTEDTLVASQEGLTLIKRNENSFSLQRIAVGAEGETAAQRGAGEVKHGKLGDRQLLATIEPMHGNQVVVYLGEEISKNMQRIVLDDTFKQGHAVWCADLDGDGRDEVIAAHRENKADGQSPGIYLYRAQDPDGQSWTRQTLDQPVACEDIHCADFDGDGRVDILAGGRATHDVNLYFNRTGDTAN